LSLFDVPVLLAELQNFRVTYTSTGYTELNARSGVAKAVVKETFLLGSIQRPGADLNCLGILAGDLGGKPVGAVIRYC